MIDQSERWKRRRLPWAAAVAPIAWILSSVGASLVAQQADWPHGVDHAWETTIRPILKNRCWDCHSGDAAEAGLQLDRYTSVTSLKANRKQWQKIQQWIRVGAMPPADAESLSSMERARVVTWIEDALFHVDCDRLIDPGRVTVRRLNRVEYNNTVRDLLGVNLRPADAFPTDDVGEGFDNIGDVLSLSPLLLEKYVEAAEKIADEVVRTPQPNARRTVAPEEMSTHGSAKVGGGMVAIVSRGAATAQFDVPTAGTYRLTIRASGDLAGSELPQMNVVAGRTQRTFRVGTARPAASDFSMPVQCAAGTLEVTAGFVNDFYNPQGPPRNRDRNLFVHRMVLQGPLEVAPRSQTGLQREIDKRRPSDLRDRQQVAAAARPILRSLASRGFRRTVSDAELDRLVRLVQMAVVDRKESFERGIQIGITAILVSPHFLFRIERHPDPNDPTSRQAIGDFELASRLSYFLWSSMPDRELFLLARDGRLNHPTALRRQIQRMLADEKSRALTENFAAQWLNLRNLDEFQPAADLFPSFSDALRADMRQETYLLFRHIVQRDRPVTELLDARYTFVNQRLAKLYGMDGVDGLHFRQVRLPAHRRGVATHASVLALTSNPTRTSPVKRGKWILDNLLGAPPPEPPANVPNLDETQQRIPRATLREQLERHRADPNCAACHREMDAIGLALEHFDALGRWRANDDNGPIDSRGDLSAGERFSTPEEMLQLVAKRKSAFARCLTEKLLTYALGRGLEYYDRCAVDTIAAQLEANEYRFAALVEAIVLSDAFLKHRGEPPR